MIAPDKAARLLDDVLYQRVVECINLPKLLMVEIDLWASLSECTNGVDKALRAEAAAMVDRAIARFAADPERYAPVHPFGTQCDLCEEEVVDRKRKPRPWANGTSPAG